MRSRNRTLVKAIILLPGNALIVIPGALLWLEGGVTAGWGGGPAIIVSGILLACSGAALAFHTTRLFFRHGEGTPAPWEPPRKLVVRGAYRYVRNPMIIGVLLMLVGEALALGSFYILIWTAVFFVANNFYFILSEEPGLERRFGAEYIDYKRNVPRWIPRLRPYQGHRERSP